MDTKLCLCGCGEPAEYSATHVHYKLKTLTKYVKWEERDMGFSSPCHYWTGSLSSSRDRGKRYGRIYHLGKYRGAHRVLYEMEVGAVPEGMELHHLCQVTRCVNVAHLIPVTPRQHTRYAANVKLNDDIVRAIRTGKVSAQDWANVLNVSKSLVYQVKAGMIWTHVV